MPLPCQVVTSALDLIGSTPIVRISRLPQLADVRAEVWAKLECLNPGGSVKDRICRSMIEQAERDGLLRPGGTIIEPTSGNTGIGLALVAAVRGYRLVLTMPDTMSEERRSLLLAYGATLELTPDTKGMHGAIRRAEELLAEHPDWYMPQQFNNPANPEVHRRTTGPEIIQQLPGIDAFVSGVGTGGTITGVGDVLRAHRPGVWIAAVEPAASPVLSGGEPGYHGIQGIGAGFVPDNLDVQIYDEVQTVSDAEATEYTRAIARYEGLLVGISSGANCAAAIRVARKLGGSAVVLTVFCDTGERYLTTRLFQAEGNLSVTLDAKLVRLRGLLAELDSALVAFSGGVDSTFLLRVAHEVLGERCVALTTASSTTPADDLAEAKALAAAMGVTHVVVGTDELRIAGYAENPVNRCWFCKDNLFEICAAEATARGLATMLDGANLDDLSDHRPGLAAAAEHGVRHPLVEAGLAKSDVREASRALGLPTWDRPASPCLSSRFPYGTRITIAGLEQVAGAERWLHDRGLRELRVRYHDALARIEVPADDMPRVLALRAELVEAFRRIGFTWVALDLQGFRSGSLNEALRPQTHEGPGDEPPAPRLR